MGEARRRKKKTEHAHPPPVRVRWMEIGLPIDLDTRLRKLCPPKYMLREYLVGVLGAFADWAEAEKRRQDSPLVLPATRMPTDVPKGYVGRRM